LSESKSRSEIGKTKGVFEVGVYMPNPRRKISRSKRDKRRANWIASLNASNLSLCGNCNEMKLPHHVCPNCGYYKGKAIYTPEKVT